MSAKNIGVSDLRAVLGRNGPSPGDSPLVLEAAPFYQTVEVSILIEGTQTIVSRFMVGEEEETITTTRVLSYEKTVMLNRVPIRELMAGSVSTGSDRLERVDVALANYSLLEFDPDAGVGQCVMAAGPGVFLGYLGSFWEQGFALANWAMDPRRQPLALVFPPIEFEEEVVGSSSTVDSSSSDPPFVEEIVADVRIYPPFFTTENPSGPSRELVDRVAVAWINFPNVFLASLPFSTTPSLPVTDWTPTEWRDQRQTLEVVIDEAELLPPPDPEDEYADEVTSDVTVTYRWTVGDQPPEPVFSAAAVSSYDQYRTAAVYEFNANLA
jgi:hypothetical protein